MGKPYAPNKRYNNNHDIGTIVNAVFKSDVLSTLSKKNLPKTIHAITDAQ